MLPRARLLLLSMFACAFLISAGCSPALRTAILKKDGNAVGRLLESGITPNLIENGEPAIHAAVRSGDIGILKRLMDKGAEVDLPGKNGQTALILAAELDFYDGAVYLLESGASPELRMADGHNAVWWSARNGNRKLFQSLILRGGAGHINRTVVIGRGKAKRYASPLSVAALYGHKETVEVILEAGAFVENAEVLAASHGKVPEVVGMISRAKLRQTVLRKPKSVVKEQRKAAVVSNRTDGRISIQYPGSRDLNVDRTIRNEIAKSKDLRIVFFCRGEWPDSSKYRGEEPARKLAEVCAEVTSYYEERMLGEFGGLEKFKIVDRQILSRLMSEQELSSTGAISAKTANRLGELSGASHAMDVLITMDEAQAIHAEGLIAKVSSRLIHIETGEVLAVDTSRP